MKDAAKSSVRRSAFVVKARSFAKTAVAKNILLLKQLWVWPIFAAVVLAAMGWFLQRVLEDSIRQEVASELQMLLQTDVTALHYWMESQEANAATAASDLQVASLTAKLLQDLAPDAGQLELLRRPELDALRAELQPTLAAQGYVGFVVINPQGIVVASSHNDPIGRPAVFGEFDSALERALAGRATIVPPTSSQILLPDKDGKQKLGLPTMFALAPIEGADRKVIAVLGLRIDPLNEFVPILSVARSGASGETYAFNRAGIMVSQSRFDDQLKQYGLLAEDEASILKVALRDPGIELAPGTAAAKSRSEQPLTRIAALGIAGEPGVDVTGFRDYRGVPVVGAWSWMPEYDIGVATKIDVAEAFRTLHILRDVFFGMLGLLAASAVAIFIFTVRMAKLQQEAKLARLQARQLGQYTLDEKLGEGGMGVVYRAHHALLHRPTAVKFLSIEKTNEQAIARFEREVQLTSQLNHPNTIAIYDFGRTEDGIFYYVMEYLDGLNLEELVQQYGPQPDGRVVNILRQVCASLEEAHRLGLVHRDIKPANIALTARGGVWDMVKVLDFGLVKSVDSEQQLSLTTSGGFTGTPLYLSPEAISRPESVDARSDLYAVGAVGYFLLTGTPVFEGKNVLAVLQSHAQQPPQSLAERLGRPVSADVERLILQCLAKDPAARPQSARQLRQELAKCLLTANSSEEDLETWWREMRPAATTSTAFATTSAESTTDAISLDATLDSPLPKHKT